MSFRFWRACSECARVTILFDEVKEFYVPGDSISGKLVLTLLDSSYSFEHVSLFIQCQEICENEKGDEGVYTRWYRESIDNFVDSILSLNMRGSGQVERNFRIYLDPEIYRSLPPSLIAEVDKYSAISWIVSAKAEVAKKSKMRRWYPTTISDGTPFEFHPTDIDKPLTDLVIIPNAGLSPMRFRLPHRLPQWPTKFSVQVELDETSPVTKIDFIRMFLEKRVLIMNRNESVITYETMLLAEFNDITLSETNRHINTSCQLKKREPAGFSSYRFCVQYLFRAQYLCGFKMQECVIVVDVTPPSPKSRTSSCRQLSRTPYCVQLPGYHK